MIVAADDVAHGKPDPEGYLRALEALGNGISPSDVVAFEDTEAGVASARAAGLRCLAVRGTLPDERLAEADGIVDEIGIELVEVARRMTWVIAHRGASADERENTIPAFERAIELGADFVELDVQVSADGALVVFHDLDLDRLTPLRGPLRRRTLAELREHGIPTLEEVVDLTRGRIGVMAELKRAYLYRRHDVVGRTVALLGPEDVVLSFCAAHAPGGAPPVPLASRPPARGYGVSIRAASSYAWAVGFHDPRVTERGLARPARARDDRLHGQRRGAGCVRSPRSAWTGPSRIVRVEHGRQCVVAEG